MTPIPVNTTGQLIAEQGWLGEVEGLRGLASLWVFAFHVGIACGTTLPIVSSGGRGVDLFILISGFIMVHQFLRRKTVEPWNDSSTIVRFWIRRFFRIAPLYYPLLLVSLASHMISDRARDQIMLKYSIPMVARHSEPTFTNLLTHVTFAFGVLPTYSSSTPLPDWSIGLEIQFYLVFPFVMLLILKTGYKWAIPITLISLAGMSSAVFFPSFVGRFMMPSFLPLRAYVFGMGMLIAARAHNVTGRIWPFLLGLPVVAHFLLPGVNMRIVLAQGFLALFLLGVSMVHTGRIRLLFAILSKLLSNSMTQRLGLISYSLYLVHLPIAFSLIALLLKLNWFSTLPSFLRFLLSFCVCSCAVIPLAALLYTFVEKPGVQLGKMIAQRLTPRFPENSCGSTSSNAVEATPGAEVA